MHFAWDDEKNEHLKRTRGVSFEAAAYHIQRGDVLDILEHPNQARYRSQRLFVLNIGGYAYLVPFVESERHVFLKKIIRSRKATRDYLKEGGRR